jgi:hypothetical protein
MFLCSIHVVFNSNGLFIYPTIRNLESSLTLFTSISYSSTESEWLSLLLDSLQLDSLKILYEGQDILTF